MSGRFTRLGVSILLALLNCLGCRKDPGEGGNSTIRGVLYSENVYGNTQGTVSPDDFEPDENVFISYGSKSTYDDNYKTSYDGSFEFKYLRPGTYQVFSYSIDPATKAKVPVVKTITLKSNEIQTIPDLIIKKDANSGGTARIKGRVYVKNYNSTFTRLNESYYAAGEDVYIVYGNSPVYNDKIKTSYDGSFEFNKLRKGSYKIFVWSKDSTRLNAGKVPAEQAVEINARGQQVTLSELTEFK